VVYDRNFMKLRLRQGMRGERAEAIYPAGDDFLQVRGQSRIEFQQERCECWQKLNQARRGIALQLGNQRATAFKSLITDALGEPNQDRIRTIEAPLHSGAMLIDRPARSSRPQRARCPQRGASVTLPGLSRTLATARPTWDSLLQLSLPSGRQRAHIAHVFGGSVPANRSQVAQHSVRTG